MRPVPGVAPSSTPPTRTDFPLRGGQFPPDEMTVGQVEQGANVAAFRRAEHTVQTLCDPIGLCHAACFVLLSDRVALDRDKGAHLPICHRLLVGNIPGERSRPPIGVTRRRKGLATVDSRLNVKISILFRRVAQLPLSPLGGGAGW